MSKGKKNIFIYIIYMVFNNQSISDKEDDNNSDYEICVTMKSKILAKEDTDKEDENDEDKKDNSFYFSNKKIKTTDNVC